MKNKANLNYFDGKTLEDTELELKTEKERKIIDENFSIKRESIDLYEKYYKDLPVGSRIERSIEACEFLADMCRFVWLRGGGVMTID